MKGILIAIITFAILFAIAALIEKYTKNETVAEIAEFLKDAFGILMTMLIFWFIYCIIC